VIIGILDRLINIADYIVTYELTRLDVHVPKIGEFESKVQQIYVFINNIDTRLLFFDKFSQI